MRPYLTILRDAFHEAFASRVLWAVLGLITLFLAGLAPLGVREEAGWYLDRGDFVNYDALLTHFATSAAKPQPSPPKHLWSLLSPEVRALIAEPPGMPDAGTRRWRTARQLRHELNDHLPKRQFFDEESWKGVRLTGEVRGLYQRGLDKLSTEQLSRFNRLALEAAMPDQFAPIRARQTRLTYLGWEPANPLSLNRKQLDLAIGSLLLAFMAYFLGTVGVLVGIVVTANLIPQTFEPGAVDLLLSKPISRVLLFLTKFLGGLAFIATSATYCIVGLWLIVGWRFDLWNEKLLLCIPLYLFLFSIYYAVSALTGLVWRNAVLSVVLTIVFWAVCTLMGVAKFGLETWVLDPQRLVRVVPADDTLIAVNERGDVFHWQAQENNWEPAFHDVLGRLGPFGTAPTLVGPLYDRTTERLIAATAAPTRFGPLSTPATLLVGSRLENWKRTLGVNVPDGTAALWIDTAGKIFAASPKGVFRLEGDAKSRRPNVNLFGFSLPFPDAGGRFVAAGPALKLGAVSAAFHGPSGAAALFDGEDLVVLEADPSGTYRQRATVKMPAPTPGLVAFGSGAVLLALADGRVQLRDPLNLAERATFVPQQHSAPRFAIQSPDGRYVGVAYHNRRLELFDAPAAQRMALALSSQGDISAASLGTDGRLWVADRLTRVSEYRLEGLRRQTVVERPLDVLESLYYYLLRPLYALFPKPGELDQTMTYLLTGDDTAALVRPKEELGARRMKLDVWGPIYSNLAFLAVVLTIACVYIHRKDF